MFRRLWNFEIWKSVSHRNFFRRVDLFSSLRNRRFFGKKIVGQTFLSLCELVCKVRRADVHTELDRDADDDISSLSVSGTRELCISIQYLTMWIRIWRSEFVRSNSLPMMRIRILIICVVLWASGINRIVRLAIRRTRRLPESPSLSTDTRNGGESD